MLIICETVDGTMLQFGLFHDPDDDMETIAIRFYRNVATSGHKPDVSRLPHWLRRMAPAELR